MIAEFWVYIAEVIMHHGGLPVFAGRRDDPPHESRDGRKVGAVSSRDTDDAQVGQDVCAVNEIFKHLKRRVFELCATMTKQF